MLFAYRHSPSEHLWQCIPSCSNHFFKESWKLSKISPLSQLVDHVVYVCQVFEGRLILGGTGRGHRVGLNQRRTFLSEFSQFFGSEKGLMVKFLGYCAVLTAELSYPLVIFSHIIRKHIIKSLLLVSWTRSQHRLEHFFSRLSRDCLSLH